MNKSWIATVVAGIAVGGVAVAAAALLADDASPSSRDRTAQASAPEPEPVSSATPIRTVTVAGEGVVTVKPDKATINIGVSVIAETANDALRQAADKADALIKTLKASGVAGDDIQTSNLSLYPQYDSNGRTITGYNVANSLTVTIRKIDTVGTVIDAGAAFVGNEITISGISFSLDDKSAAIAEARAVAIADSKLRADQYTGAAGASVGQVLTISEVSVSPPQPLYYEYAAADEGKGAPTPIEAGTQDLSVTVNVTYALD